jgi:murein DD-endopeptidase MepM/ murein hydrolase activator NlpD
MQKKVTYGVHAVFGVMVLCCVAAHADPLPIVREDTAAPSKRFISLDDARRERDEKQNGVSIVHEKKSYPLRSDREQMGKGMMLLDRTRTVAVPTQKTIATAPSQAASPANAVDNPYGVSVFSELDRESDEIEGNTDTIDPVLALFDDSSSEMLGSFHDVLSGKTSRSGRSAAGLVRHLMWPIPHAAKQYVSSGYGIRNDPFHGRPTFHGGIDIAAETGTPVLATADGKVQKVAADKNYGKYVTLEHADGTLTRYGHLSAQNVAEGQRVKAGQAIGAVGSTGRSTGAHLDYRVSKNGVKYDPLSILSVPSSVAIKTSSKTRMAAMDAVNVKRGLGVASNPTPKRPMVIQVR